MVEKKAKAEGSETAEKKAVKKPAAKKTTDTTAKKAAPAKKEAAATAAPKEKKAPAQAASGKTVTLIQTGSPIGRQKYQRDTLIGLGLNKINRKRTLADTPSLRGMIEKVKHLVKVVE